MNNFWSNNNRPTSGSLFGKKSSISPAAVPPPGTATPAPKGSTSSGRMSGLAAAATTPPPGKNATVSDAAVKVKFDHDYACGVFVGAFDIPSMRVTVDVVEVTDPGTQKVERHEQWLRTNDMLAILTREYGKALQKLAGLPPAAAALPGRPAVANKDRDDATRRLTEVRDQVVCTLHSRRVYHRVKEAGIRILIEI